MPGWGGGADDAKERGGDGKSGWCRKVFAALCSLSPPVRPELVEPQATEGQRPLCPFEAERYVDAAAIRAQAGLSRQEHRRCRKSSHAKPLRRRCRYFASSWLRVRSKRRQDPIRSHGWFSKRNVGSGLSGYDDDPKWRFQSRELRWRTFECFRFGFRNRPEQVIHIKFCKRPVPV